MYKDHSETIMGNMDSIVFLGGLEASTLKDISENWLGKATISCLLYTSDEEYLDGVPERIPLCRYD